MPSTDEPRSDVAGYEVRIDELERDLEYALPSVDVEVLSSERSGDEPCRIAADLRDRICDLSQRICDIADREPSTSDTALKCQRATHACGDARAHVAQRCRGR